jgi:hypothetical protein
MSVALLHSRVLKKELWWLSNLPDDYSFMRDEEIAGNSASV